MRRKRNEQVLHTMCACVCVCTHPSNETNAGREKYGIGIGFSTWFYFTASCHNLALGAGALNQTVRNNGPKPIHNSVRTICFWIIPVCIHIQTIATHTNALVCMRLTWLSQQQYNDITVFLPMALQLRLLCRKSYVPHAYNANAGIKKLQPEFDSKCKNWQSKNSRTRTPRPETLACLCCLCAFASGKFPFEDTDC